MSEEIRDVPAFACCSAGIGRWFWVAWGSEAEARAFSPALASGYESSADRAEAKAAERFGPQMKRLPAKWASGYKRRGGASGRTSGAEREAGGGGETRPGTRLSRPVGASRPHNTTRVAFLYAVTEREPPDLLENVAVTRHRIVKQTARKIHVESDAFDEDEWARRKELAGESPETAPKTRTVAVDRVTLRTEGRFRAGRAHPGLTFYASEDDGIRDVAATLTARYAWCARLGVRFPCSVDTIKAAYRQLAMTSHPDAGGDPAAFRLIEQAYREALAFFAQGG